MASSDSKVASLQNHFQSLSEIAVSLNSASDELTKAVAILDEALKKLGIGLTAWVEICSRAVEDHEFDDDELGYAKVQGKWGLALRRVWGDQLADTYNEEGPWLFNDAPRELRLRSVDVFPKLIEKLHLEASATVKKVEEKTKQVRELAGAITAAEEDLKKLKCIGLSRSQVREIISATHEQSKFLGELVEHSNSWELSERELRLYFSAEKRPFAEMLDGQDSRTKLVRAASKVVGKTVTIALVTDVPTSEKLGGKGRK